MRLSHRKTGALRKIALICAIFLGYSAGLNAEVDLADDCDVIFASQQQGGEILAARDDYLIRLSPFDRTSRLQRTEPVSTEEFVLYSRKQAVTWGGNERQRLVKVLEQLKRKIAPFAEYLPKQVELVKTTGGLEAGSAYTRGTAIFLPGPFMAQMPDQKLMSVLIHELFHVLSRNNPQLRDRLYQAIGFVKSPELTLPESLQATKITNPDVPVLTHLIQVEIDGKPQWVTPLIYSARAYNPKKAKSFFSYVTLKLLVYQWDGSSQPEPLLVDGEPRLVSLDEVDGLFEQIGRNTDYLFHAEEVLADNFVLLVMDKDKETVRSPDVLEKIRAAFKRN